MEKTHTSELIKLTKPFKDNIKSYMDDICEKYALSENVNYKFERNLFVIDTAKRAIKDRLKSLMGTHFNFNSNIEFYIPVDLTVV